MAELQQKQRHPQQQFTTTTTEGIRSILPEKAPSTSTVLAVVTLVPLGGFLLLIAGLTLLGTVFSLALATPLFVICSPILVPAALVIAFSLTGFLTAGAFGISALSCLSWLANFVRRMRMPEQMEHVKRRVQDTTGHMGQKAKETGQGIQGKAHDITRPGEGGKATEAQKT